ncbi:hypothetical protein [Mesorhizobium sp.]|uniref:hypothetical protein n=1 Tax=Mesorhizobium sp. TaxID=1871066 RepID=UPI0025F6AD8C|nr:hypothetical protein [Mesorhizobium sp.]
MLRKAIIDQVRQIAIDADRRLLAWLRRVDCDLRDQVAHDRLGLLRDEAAGVDRRLQGFEIAQVTRHQRWLQCHHLGRLRLGGERRLEALTLGAQLGQALLGVCFRNHPFHVGVEHAIIFAGRRLEA